MHMLLYVPWLVCMIYMNHSGQALYNIGTEGIAAYRYTIYMILCVGTSTVGRLVVSSTCIEQVLLHHTVHLPTLS